MSTNTQIDRLPPTPTQLFGGIAIICLHSCWGTGEGGFTYSAYCLLDDFEKALKLPNLSLIGGPGEAEGLWLPREDYDLDICRLLESIPHANACVEVFGFFGMAKDGPPVYIAILTTDTIFQSRPESDAWAGSTSAELFGSLSAKGLSLTTSRQNPRETSEQALEFILSARRHGLAIAEEKLLSKTSSASASRTKKTRV